MQFTGAKGITVFVAIVLIVCGTGFGSGLLVGRHYPAHGYQKYGETRFMLDTATGRLCDPFKDPNAPVDLGDLFGKDTSGTPYSAYKPEQPDPFDKYAVKPSSSYPPPCGK